MWCESCTFPGGGNKGSYQGWGSPGSTSTKCPQRPSRPRAGPVVLRGGDCCSPVLLKLWEKGKAGEGDCQPTA